MTHGEGPCQSDVEPTEPIQGESWQISRHDVQMRHRSCARVRLRCAKPEPYNECRARSFQSGIAKLSSASLTEIAWLIDLDINNQCLRLLFCFICLLHCTFMLAFVLFRSVMVLVFVFYTFFLTFVSYSVLDFLVVVVRNVVVVPLHMQKAQ